MKIDIIRGADKIKALIGKVGKASESIKDMIQSAAVSCAVHAIEHGDVTLMTELHNTMGPGWHRASLAAWALKYGPFGWKNKDKETGKAEGYTFAKDKADKLKAEDIKVVEERIASKPWYLEKKEKQEFEGFDLKVEMDRLIARASKIEGDSVKASNAKTDLHGLDQLRKLRKLLSPGNNNTPTPTGDAGYAQHVLN